MSTENWMSLLLEAKGLGCKKVQFIGGEPLIHPDLDKMILTASDLGYDFIEVYTNATKLNRKWCEFFNKHGVSVATSFYSHDPAIHASITRNENSFRKTVAGIRAAIDTEIPIRVGIIDVTNQDDVVGSAREFLSDLGVGHKNISVDKNRLIGRGESAFKRQNEDEGKVDPYSQLCGFCWRGRLAVTSDGAMFPCVISRFHVVGNYFEQGLIGALYSSELLSFRQTQRAQTARQVTNMAQSKPPFEFDPMSVRTSCTPDRCEPQYDCNPGCLPVEPDDDDIYIGRSEARCDL